MNTTMEVFLKLLACGDASTKDIAQDLDISLRNTQRAIKEIKLLFDKNPTLNQFFQLKKNGHNYTICQRYLLHTNQVLVITKILIASRSLNKTELPQLVNKMFDMLALDQRSLVSESVMSEQITDNYIDDDSQRIEKIGQLEEYIFHRNTIQFQYTDHEAAEKTVTKTVEMLPVHTFFDNYYFFIVGILKDTGENKTFRIDWMDNIQEIKIKLPVNHSQHHDHGRETRYEAFGYMGKRTRIRFEYYGYIGYIKDQFPTCKVIKKIDKPNKFPFSVNILEIEVNYSDGVKLWLLGETTILRVLSPQPIADDIKATLLEGYQRYLED